MMRLHPARLRLLVEYARMATDGTPQQRSEHRGDVADFLRVLWDDATTAARQAYVLVMGGVPSEPFAWAAVRPRGPRQPPPAVVLLRGQATDDAELAPAGHIVPNPIAEPAWRPLYQALERWDTEYLLHAMTPTGWRIPGELRKARLLRIESPTTSRRTKSALIAGGAAGAVVLGGVLLHRARKHRPPPGAKENES